MLSDIILWAISHQTCHWPGPCGWMADCRRLSHWLISVLACWVCVWMYIYLLRSQHSTTGNWAAGLKYHRIIIIIQYHSFAGSISSPPPHTLHMMHLSSNLQRKSCKGNIIFSCCSYGSLGSGYVTDSSELSNFSFLSLSLLANSSTFLWKSLEEKRY